MDGGLAAFDSRSPEATRDRLLELAPALLPALGVTRLADQTGLDTLGIPVVAAMRPNSRSVAVHQGKGLSKAAAKVSALMEAAECYHAETCELPLRWARPGALANAVDPQRLARTRDDIGDAPFLWVEGRDMVSGRTGWVPYELVHADYTAPQPAGSHLFQATTNGLGAGLAAAQAQLHALCEAVERDAVAAWRQEGGPHGPAPRPIDPASVTDPDCAWVLRRCAEARVQVAIWELTRETGVPVFICLLVPPDGGLAGIEPELGAGGHPRPATALLRALLEAAQARVTRIAGARDDFAPASYDAAARKARQSQAQAWHAAASRPLPFRPGPEVAAGFERQRDAVLDGLVRAGYREAFWVDLSKPALPVTVGRAVVPGLLGPAVAADEVGA
ncbi:MAG TPA: YcaO-like family protein [Acetobacteraceae bacterium]|nr:YcaO-like family protein [Acetobacteraceae bacterium]